MRAFLLTGPRAFEVVDVEPPAAAPGLVVVDVELAGVCGTDVEFFTGEMTYLHTGQASYPMRLGHEWCGRVSSVGAGVDPRWIGRRTTGDTMLGCGSCARCAAGRHHVCADRYEIGVRNGWAGALAEQIAVPVTALHEIPEDLDSIAGAMVEPGGSALRAVHSAHLAPGDRLLVLGPGTIGLLAASFARAAGIEVHLLGIEARSLEFARALGFPGVWRSEDLPDLAWDAVIDTSTASELPSRALELVEPGKRVVFLGIAGVPSTIDARAFVFKDVTAIGILGASAGLDGTIAQYSSGAVDPRPLVAGTVGLGRVGDVLGGWRPADSGPGPKILADPSQ